MRDGTGLLLVSGSLFAGLCVNALAVWLGLRSVASALDSAPRTLPEAPQAPAATGAAPQFSVGSLTAAAPPAPAVTSERDGALRLRDALAMAFASAGQEALYRQACASKKPGSRPGEYEIDVTFDATGHETKRVVHRPVADPTPGSPTRDECVTKLSVPALKVAPPGQPGSATVTFVIP